MNGAKDIFLSDSIGLTNLCMSDAKNFTGDRRRVRVEIRLYSKKCL